MTDLQLILSTLSGYTIPEEFVPTTDPAPDQPESLSDMFGVYPEQPDYASAFNSYYDQETNTWKTDDRRVAPDDLRSDVAGQLALIQAYEVDFTAWTINYTFERDFQWRRKIADRILETTM